MRALKNMRREKSFVIHKKALRTSRVSKAAYAPMLLLGIPPFGGIIV